MVRGGRCRSDLLGGGVDEDPARRRPMGGMDGGSDRVAPVLCASPATLPHWWGQVESLRRPLRLHDVIRGHAPPLMTSSGVLRSRRHDPSTGSHLIPADLVAPAPSVLAAPDQPDEWLADWDPCGADTPPGVRFGPQQTIRRSRAVPGRHMSHVKHCGESIRTRSLGCWAVSRACPARLPISCRAVRPAKSWPGLQAAWFLPRPAN